ncbi:MAG TPA: MFS transporter [Opitutaceae bacterium]|nr:MFS transporter [Opitutaceae bacterium]
MNSPNEATRRATKKAFWRLLPLLFVCYAIAYVDRANVSIAKLAMAKEMPAFDDAVIGFGAGIFFIGYFLLEVPGSLIVERWSARKWICRIMITWGIVAALTAFVKTPTQFYVMRFLLGLSEAGFFPGVIVFLGHWFPSRERARALATFFVASPIAQMLSPSLSFALLKIGMTETVNGQVVTHPAWLGLHGWQWIYILWALPAVLLGFVVLFFLTDRPRDAKWLTAEERDSLEAELARENAEKRARGTSLWHGLGNPRILLLAMVFFCTTTANYGIEFFLPTILFNWYGVRGQELAWLVALPSILVLLGQLFVGWNSDRLQERRWHVLIPLILSASALAVVPLTHGNLPLTVLCFIVGAAGLKVYMPAFWALPSLLLTASAAAGSVGLINSIGNLGGFLGPSILGQVSRLTSSFVIGLYILAGMVALGIAIVACLRIGGRGRTFSQR